MIGRELEENILQNSVNNLTPQIVFSIPVSQSSSPSPKTAEAATGFTAAGFTPTVDFHMVQTTPLVDVTGFMVFVRV